MKKFFIEPDIQRLKLNLNENIASSSGCELPNFDYINFNGITMQDGESYLTFMMLYIPMLQNRDVAGTLNLLKTPQWAKCIQILQVFHDS